MIVLYRSRGLFMTGDSVQTGHNVNTPPSQDLLLGENKSGIESRCAFKDSTGNLMSQGVSDSSMKFITEDELVVLTTRLTDPTSVSSLNLLVCSLEHRPKSFHVSSMLLKPF